MGALGTFAAAQAEVVHVPMDADGLIPAALRAALDAADRRRPAGEVPLHGARTSTTRPGSRSASHGGRRSSRSAERHDLLVIEDNPYGLLGFEGDAAGTAVAWRRSG